MKPKFNKKLPEEWHQFFSPDADIYYKRSHPVKYKVLCLIGVFVLMLPVSLFILYTTFINPAPNESGMFIGFVSTFVMGVGFFNIVAAWLHQYLGHCVTVVCIGGGALFTVLSLLLLYL